MSMFLSCVSITLITCCVQRLDFIDVATGSLGQGLSCAAGMAYVGKYIDKASYRVYCLIGDGESAEGSIWEAAGRLSSLLQLLIICARHTCTMSAIRYLT
jgi:transketolase N-terminal domain/subunit